jgi:hypothetical protein
LGGELATKGIHNKITGGTGKYKNATGGATYFYDNITDTLSAGRYKVEIVLP